MPTHRLPAKALPATTVAAIAAEASVSEPTVYATFGAKGAILREMMDEHEELATTGSLWAGDG